MAIRKKVTKKRAAKKKVVRKKVAATNRNAEVVAKLRASLKEAKDENRELKKKVREGDKQVAALLKLLETTQTAANKFLGQRVKDAVKKYGVVTAPKKRRRRTRKKAK
jgi:hypothetical protein